MDLPLLSAAFAAFSLTLYVMLDGFDLGVGTLLLMQPSQRMRDRMVDAITPTWDGNETWLVMAGVTLLAGFPIAYGILLPAFYLPLIVMLLALGLRGVSFEFRSQVSQHRWMWDAAFGVGSLLAALMQGLILGGVVQGVSVSGERFSGGVLDVFRPLAVVVAISLVAGYSVLGAAWLHLKTVGPLRTFAERGLRWGLVLFLLLAVVACVAAAAQQPAIARAWTTHVAALTLITAGFFAAAVYLLRAIGSKGDAVPFALGLLLFALGIAGLATAVFPDIVPFQLTLWQAASSTRSHVFLLVGAVFVTPVVLAYSAFAYRVFRGKVPEQGWEM
jgi:cytochrome d ubiquinol oxidase subunit II